MTKDNVMHYFRWSPYWDRTSTNQLLRMQTEFSENKIDTDAEEHLRFLSRCPCSKERKKLGLMLMHGLSPGTTSAWSLPWCCKRATSQFGLVSGVHRILHEHL